MGGIVQGIAVMVTAMARCGYGFEGAYTLVLPISVRCIIVLLLYLYCSVFFYVMNLWNKVRHLGEDFDLVVVAIQVLVYLGLGPAQCLVHLQHSGHSSKVVGYRMTYHNRLYINMKSNYLDVEVLSGDKPLEAFVEVVDVFATVWRLTSVDEQSILPSAQHKAISTHEGGRIFREVYVKLILLGLCPGTWYILCARR